jgi:PAS domain S-box-containing protein
MSKPFSGKKLFPLLGLWLLFISAAGQTYSFRNYSLKDGLPQSEVTCMFEDSKGYLWMGTNGGGVSRFDGSSFTNYGTKDGICSDFITGICEDTSGNMWLATSKGISKFDGRHAYNYIRKDFKLSAYFLKSLATTSGDLAFATDKSLVIFRAGKLQEFAFPAVSEIPKIFSMAEDANHNIWITTDSGLFLFDGIAVSNVSSLWLGISLDDAAYCIADSLHNLWFCKNSGTIFKLNTQNSKDYRSYIPDAVRYNFGPPKGEITGMIFAKSGNIWLTTASGEAWTIYRAAFWGGGASVITEKNGLEAKHLTGVIQDRNQFVWFASSGAGIFRFGQQRFVTYENIEGLNYEDVFAVYQETDGTIWSGTRSKGFFRFNQSTIKTAENYLPDLAVYGFTPSPKDSSRILVSTSDGVWVYQNKATKKLVIKNVPEKTRITFCKYDPEGNLWVGTYGLGIVKVDPNGNETVFNSTNSDLARYVYTYTYVNSRLSMLGTNGGVYFLRDGKITLDSNSFKSGSPVISNVAQDKFGNYWFAGGESILVYAGDSVYSYTTKDGLASILTYTLIADASGNIWIGTNRGLDQVFVAPEGKISSITNYSYAQGFRAMETNTRACFLSNNGTILLGTVLGVTACTPVFKAFAHRPPTIILNEVNTLGQDTLWQDESVAEFWYNVPKQNHVFKHETDNITFLIGIINPSDPEAVMISYKLEGGSNVWSSLVSTRELNITNLKPGKYVFHARATSDGFIFGDEIIYSFEIETPYWKTGWFLLMLIFLILGLGALALYGVLRSKSRSALHNRDLNISLRSSRMIILFAAVAIPILVVLANYIDSTIPPGGIGLVFVALTLLACWGSTFFLRWAREHVTSILKFAFIFTLAYVFVLMIHSHIHPFYVIGMILVFGTTISIFNDYKSVVVISLLTLATTIIIHYTEERPEYNTLLLIASTSACLAVLLLNLSVKLVQQEKLLFSSGAVNKGSSIVVSSDFDGNILFVSENVREILGYEADSLLGQGWWEKTFVDAADHQMSRDMIYNRTGQEAYSRRVKTQDGKHKWIQWVDKKISDNLIVFFGQDVTSSIEFQKRYEYLVTNAEDGIYSCDAAGYFTLVNAKVELLTGFTSEELIGKRFSDFLPAHAFDAAFAYYIRILENKIESSYYELPIQRKGGGEVWVGQQVKLLFDEADPSIVKGFLAVARDITEKRKYVQEIERLSVVAEKTTAGILTLDSENRVKWMNKGMETMLGYSLEEMIGNRPADILAGPETNMEIVERSRNMEFKKAAAVFETVNYKKTGEKIWLEVNTTPIFDSDNQLLELIEIITDITARKEAEEELKQSRLKLQDYSEELELLNSIKEKIILSDDFDSITKEALGLILNALDNCIRISLYTFDEGNDMASGYQLSGGELIRVNFALSDFKSLPTLREGKPFAEKSLANATDRSESDQMVFTSGVKSYIIFPIMSSQKLLGSINIGFSEDLRMSDQERQMLENTTGLLGVAVEQFILRNNLIERDKDITDSINYALQIQEAVLPLESKLKELIADSFLFFAPRDIVSGDFYWIEEREDQIMIAVGDCTGHGVPGAFMTMLGMNFMQQYAQTNTSWVPSDLIRELDLRLVNVLNKKAVLAKEKQRMILHDGMELGVAIIDRKKQTLTFAGSGMRLIWMNQHAINESVFARKTVGDLNTYTSLENVTIPWSSDNAFYLFSDGIVDQIGGERSRRFSKKQIYELLSAVCALPMQEQKNQIKDAFTKWKGQEKQTDDVIILGFRNQ